MAYFPTKVLDNQIKALPTVSTASGSVATFDTDMTENLVEVKCQIVATQSGSGTPSPSNPRPITTYTSLNLSHSGADTSNPTITNIPFGQTVAKGTLNVSTGVLRVTHGVVLDMSQLSWTKGGDNYFAELPETIKRPSSAGEKANIVCEIFATAPQTSYTQNNNQITYYYTGSTEALSKIIVYSTDYADLPSFETAITGYKLMWELATPIEIQLDSITLQALLNENNIWCDTGDTEVKYLLTVGKKIS